MEIKQSIIEIAKELPNWFTKEAITKISKNLEKFPFIVNNEKEVSGFLIYDLKKSKCNILWMAVRKSNQRKGIGKRLISELVKICKKNNISKIHVDTLADTEDYGPYKITRKFYLSQGFYKLKVISRGYSEGSDKLILEKKL